MNNGYPKFLDDFHRERNTKAFYETQGFTKLWNYFCAVTESNHFQQTVSEIRSEYDIPENGIALPEKGSWSIPHSDWKHATDRSLYQRLKERTRELSIVYGLLPKDWSHMIESYIFHNIILISPEPNSCNVCFVSDGLTKNDSLGHDVTEDHFNVYPVTLHISPYASKRDILNYVEKIYVTEIEPLQKKYQNPDIKIGQFKSRDKSIQKRDRFIEKNAHLPRKELLKKVKESFPKALTESLDQGSIGKVISYRKKRRQKV
ncbi:MAG: hypothetical protein KIH67_001880 [Candidatus Moranbacteria bacterium]|nr:hypothetical protein [Candidatus Moranbacteria bacterium]